MWNCLQKHIFGRWRVGANGNPDLPSAATAENNAASAAEARGRGAAARGSSGGPAGVAGRPAPYCGRHGADCRRTDPLVEGEAVPPQPPWDVGRLRHRPGPVLPGPSRRVRRRSFRGGHDARPGVSCPRRAHAVRPVRDARAVRSGG